MRDILEDIFSNEPLDPTESARRSLRAPRRKRFYERAEAGDSEPFAVLLDGRPVRTPARRPLAAPTRALGEALAAEWNAQGEHIDPATMPLTRLSNSIIDGVVDNPGPVADEIAKFLGSDLLFYRAGTPEGLVRQQAIHWDPVLSWARDVLGARFVLGEGVMFVEQPDGAIAAAGADIPSDPWRLGAVHTITTLTGSALLALALARGALETESAWAAAHVDEDWNMAQWGRDEIALARRAARFAEMQAAATVLALTG